MHGGTSDPSGSETGRPTRNEGRGRGRWRVAAVVAVLAVVVIVVGVAVVQHSGDHRSPGHAAPAAAPGTARADCDVLKTDHVGTADDAALLSDLLELNLAGAPTPFKADYNQVVAALQAPGGAVNDTVDQDLVTLATLCAQDGVNIVGPS